MAPDADQIEAFSDYTGLLPLECKHLFDFIVKRFQQQPFPAGGALPLLQATDWWPLLEDWKLERLAHFDEMLAAYDERLRNELAVDRAITAARALEMRLPIARVSIQFDRRLVFKRKGELPLHEDSHLFYLDALSPLVRLQVQLHYRERPSNQGIAVNLNDAIGTMLLDTSLMTNDAKGRLVEGYILHCIREFVRRGANSIELPALQGGNPWMAGGGSVKLKFKNADVVDFPGGGLPPLPMLGDLTRPKYYIPLRINFPEFDFFYLRPGRAAAWPSPARPTVIFRFSVTISLTSHGFNAAFLDLAAWQLLLPLPANVPQASAAHYVWVGKQAQAAPVAARGNSFLLDLDAMAGKGFPLLAYVRLR